MLLLHMAIILSVSLGGCRTSQSNDSGSQLQTSGVGLPRPLRIPNIQPQATRPILQKLRGVTLASKVDPLQRVTQEILKELMGNHLEYVDHTPLNVRDENTELYNLVRDLVQLDKDQHFPAILPPLFSASHTTPIDAALFDSAYTYFGPWKLMSALTLEVHRQRNFLKQKSTPTPQDLKRIDDLTAMLLVLEFRFVPITTPEYHFTKQAVLVSGKVDLEQTLVSARYVGEIENSHQPVSPTPRQVLKDHISSGDIEHIKTLASGYHYYATGRIQQVKEKIGPIFGCLAALYKTWADFRKAIKRFDDIFKRPDIPRAPGEVFRGIANFPKDALENWLTLARQGKPLYLGLDNQPEVMFTSRSYRVAVAYRDRIDHSPGNYQVILAITQKNGVSIENIVTNAKPQEVMIHSSQQFRVEEVLKDPNTPMAVVIKLQEI